MAYPGTVLRLLLAAPGDVPPADRKVILDTVNTWNVREGEPHGVAIVVMHWSDHTAAQYGIRPQESINRQLVDRCDVLLALFWHRLGSPTGEAASGTVEELEHAVAAGKYVALLKCQRPAAPTDIDTEQLEELRRFLDHNRMSALVKDYSDEATLAREVESVLLFAAGRASMATTAPSSVGSGAAVWAGAETETHQKTDSKGRLKQDLKHYLVLNNGGGRPAHHVTFELTPAAGQDGDIPMLIDGEATIPVLAPGSPMRFPALVHMGSSSLVDCTVRWREGPDTDGAEHEQVSTVRF